MSGKERKRSAPPRYDEAFKTGAVKMVTEQGRQSREVAAELGIYIDTLRMLAVVPALKAGTTKPPWHRRQDKPTEAAARPSGSGSWRRRTVR